MYSPTGYCLILNGNRYPIYQVLEAYNGDLYLQLEPCDRDGYCLFFVRLYNLPQFAEMGINNLNYILQQYKEVGMPIWNVNLRDYQFLNTYRRDFDEWRVARCDVL